MAQERKYLTVIHLDIDATDGTEATAERLLQVFDSQEVTS